MNPFIVGLDLGQANDYTAVAAVERSGGGAPYAVRYLERFELGTPYPAIVGRVRALSLAAELRGAELVVDATGVGRPVVDMLCGAGLGPVSVTITGGDTVAYGDGMYRVPKRDLVATVQVLLQTRRLLIAEALPAAETLVQELLAFEVKITASAHDVYGSWREGSHDDLVLAVALACWYGEHAPGAGWARAMARLAAGGEASRGA